MYTPMQQPSLRRSSSAAFIAGATAAIASVVLAGCGPGDQGGDSESEKVRQGIMASLRRQLAREQPTEERTKLERQLARLERGEPMLDEREALQALGYTVTDTDANPVYRNTVHGYRVAMPPGLELQRHRNGVFVIIPPHGSLFGIWTHADDPTDVVEAKLLSNFERWCGRSPDSALERQRNGGSLRLVPVSRGPFAGYKAVAKDLSDTAPARFYAFKSPNGDGYFGFNLPPQIAGALFGSLEPLHAAPLGK